MSAMPFGQKYAEIYDKVYQDKDYAREVAFLEDIFERYGEEPVTILDVACGTGGHAIELVKKGYTVTGIDASKHMIEIAKEKARREGMDVEFHVAEMQSFDLDEKFDAVFCMFSGMDYLLLYSEIMRTLANIKKHLKDGGLFICDFWNASARYAPEETKIVEDGDIKIIRASTIKQMVHGYYEVKFNFDVKEGSRTDNFSERHVLRAYYPDEIRRYLEESGFEVLKICPFMELDGEITEDVRDIMVIARC
ncbi:MAG: methyltransferase domain-containing protein [Methanocellales archaeon]|nr:methyltransferase domain-containing protein [Methanocellales archaeon]